MNNYIKKSTFMVISLRNLIVLTFLIVSSYVAYVSPGYDDEFHNIRFFHTASIGGNISDFLYMANSDPVHPSGSYLISFLGMKLLGDWSLVRMFKTILVISITYISLIKLYPNLRSKYIDFGIIVLVTPSFLLFGTGLRWGGEFLAIYTLIVTLDKFIPTQKKYFFPALAFLGVILLNINYLAIVLFPLVFTYHLYNSYSRNVPINIAAVISAIFSVCYIAYLFFRVISLDRSAQQGDIIASINGTGLGILINWGIFPISITGLLSALAMGSAVIVILYTDRQRLKTDTLFWLLLVSILALIFSGLGAKYRNALPLLPVTYGFLVSRSIFNFNMFSPSLRFFLGTCTLVITYCIMLGYYGVIAHYNTAKGSWNLPVAEVNQFLLNQQHDCPSSVVILWDPVLEYHLWRSGFNVATLDHADDNKVLNFDSDCVFLVKTTMGSNTDHGFFQTDFEFNEPVLQLGLDKFVKVKKLMGADASEYYVSIYKLDQDISANIARYFSYTHYARDSPRR